MTRRRRVGVALMVLGTVALAFGLTASPVSADAPEQTGWWFELQTKTLPVPLPSPPTAPDGGLFVQQGPQGPTAYGALRYRSVGAVSAILTLAAAPGSTTSLGAPLQACATSAPWQTPAQAPGFWEDGPKFGDPCTPGRISSDGKFVAFAFNAAFIKSGALDVAIVPIDGAAPFVIAFDKPAADSLVLTVASPATTVPPTTTPVTAPASGGTNAPARAPHVPVAPAPVPTTTAPAGDTRSPVADAQPKAEGLGDPDRGERAAALGGASAIVVGWWLLSTRATRMPHLLGALAGGGAATDAAPDTKSRVGGVGRFARNHETNPRALR